MGVRGLATRCRLRCWAGMRTPTILAFAVLLATALAGPGGAQADWDDRPEASEYDEALDSHGYWTDEPSYGRVWRPNTYWDWRPYVDGQWIWTSYGWTWVSPEPWGWTFHYGRWAYTPGYAWVWVPGYVWGPAWVNWYWGDGYVGWAPLGPPGFVVVPSYWNYVRDYHFCGGDARSFIIPPRHLPDYIVHHRERGWGFQRPPALRDIELVSRHPIDRQGDRPRDTIAPWVHRRVDRGERVREHVADRGGERVIEHAPPGRVGGRRAEPRIVDDGGWRRPQKGRGGDARHGGFIRPGQPSDDDRFVRPGQPGDENMFVRPGRPQGGDHFVRPGRPGPNDDLVRPGWTPGGSRPGWPGAAGSAQPGERGGRTTVVEPGYDHGQAGRPGGSRTSPRASNRPSGAEAPHAVRPPAGAMPVRPSTGLQGSPANRGAAPPTGGGGRPATGGHAWGGGGGGGAAGGGSPGGPAGGAMGHGGFGR